MKQHFENYANQLWYHETLIKASDNHEFVIYLNIYKSLAAKYNMEASIFTDLSN